MVNPVPGHSVTTGYKKTSTGSWDTCGWHTGQDYAAPAGATVVAARAGLVVHVNFGSGLGNHQFAIRPGDGTEDFYAHTRSRPGNGLGVEAGQIVAEVGSEGNATGPHLHFERHTSYGWSCSAMADPMLSHNHGGATAPPQPPTDGDDDMLTEPQAKALDQINWTVGQIKPQTDHINPRTLAAVENVNYLLPFIKEQTDKIPEILQRLDELESGGA